MKKQFSVSITTLLLTTLASTSAFAKFPLPDSVYTVSQLNEAKTKAKSSGKPLAFVGTDKASQCALTTAASEDIFEALKDQSVIVYVEQGDVDNLPKIAGNALNSEEAGQHIPKTVVVSSDMGKVIDILPDVKQDKRAERIKVTLAKIANYMQEHQ
jgi:hypothetical protein